MDIPGPCNWPYHACPCSGLLDSPGEPELDLIEMAKSMLWQATGRVFGPCPISVLPCASDLPCGCGRGGIRSCGCRTVPEVKLPGPVTEVTGVWVDGEELDPFAYRIDDYNWLVRLDGGSWPVDADPLAPDSFRVDYLIGVPPPAGAGMMAGELACELAKAKCDDDTCRLPRRVRRITRAGVTAEWNPGDGFGLPDVDSWVENALAPILAGAVWSPDAPKVRRITWEASP